MGKWDDPEYRKKYFQEYAERNRSKRSEQGAAWREAHKEEVRAKGREYTQAHAEENRKRARDWYYANPEKAREQRKKWNEENKDVVREYNKRYREENREKLLAFDKARNSSDERREYNRMWAREHAEQNRAKVRAWAKAHPEQVKALGSEVQKRRHQRMRDTSAGPIDYAAITERCAGVCGICGKDVLPEDHSFDHIIPIGKGGPHVTENIQVAHLQCNRLKAARLDYSPE